MKTTLSILAALVIGTVTIGISALAEEHMGGKEMGHMMMHGEKEDMMMKKDMPMMGGGMMMGRMMQPKIVATSDGGAIVVIGRKLIKYDKNLNVASEAEIKVDEKEMMDMMKKMHTQRMKCMEMMMEEEEEEEENAKEE